MSILDDATNLPDPSEVSFQSTAMRYGLIGGAILIIVSALNFMFGLGGGFILPILFSVATFAVYIVIMVMAVRHHRDNELGGAITLGRAFMVAFVTSILIALINTLFAYLYINFIDPGYMDTLLEQSRGMYESFGMAEEQIEEALKQVEVSFTPMRQLLGLGVGALVGAVIAVIIGAIMKKEAPLQA